MWQSDGIYISFCLRFFFSSLSLLSQNIVMIGDVVWVPMLCNNHRGVWYREVDVTRSSRLFFTWFSICPAWEDAQRGDSCKSLEKQKGFSIFLAMSALWRCFCQVESCRRAAVNLMLHLKIVVISKLLVQHKEFEGSISDYSSNW